MTNETLHDDLIRYDVMVQEALVGVVRRVLIDAARNGLPGEHHFYISFRTKAPNVRLSARLREKFPDEMTVVLQHQFWDLIITEQSFEVGLSFDGIPERLLVPFDSMTGFYDPSVQFGLKFAAEETRADNDLSEDEVSSVKSKLDAITEHEKTKKSKPRAVVAVASVADEKPAPVKRPRVAKSKTDTASEAPVSVSVAAPPHKDDQPPRSGAQVVSLEAFRKKK